MRPLTLAAFAILVIPAFAFAQAAAEVTGLQHVANVPLSGANDFAYRDGLVYMGSLNAGMRVIDVSNPASPVVLGSAPCRSKDLNLVELPDGRILATLASQSNDGCPGASGTGGIRLVDVTNPAAPIVGKQVPLKYGSHTHTPYGNTGLIYNSAYNLLANLAASPMDHHRSEIVDVSDPSNPRVVKEFMFPATSTSIGCHDILAEPQYDRTICAAISETQIWNTSDPVDPILVSTILNPLITIHHSAATTRDGDLLVIGDEWAGAIAPGSCATGGAAPTGAAWAYDISDPTIPVPLGYWAPDEQSTRLCTIHEFNFVPGTDTLVASAYQAGVFVVDFSDPTFPTTIAHHRFANSNAWAGYSYAGLAITGDTARGMDVYRLT